jgi:hypothetical protein
MRTFALVLALASAVAMSACSKQLKMDTVKTSIASGLASKLGLEFDAVNCPDTRDIKTGDTFACTAVVKGGGELPVTVTQKDDQGNIVWKLTSSENLIDLSAVESNIVKGLKEQASVDAAVTCGGAKYRVSLSGKSFDCQAKISDGRDAKVTVAIKDDKGNISWSVGE